MPPPPKKTTPPFCCHDPSGRTREDDKISSTKKTGCERVCRPFGPKQNKEEEEHPTMQNMTWEDGRLLH